jgi:hypothetical protein
MPMRRMIAAMLLFLGWGAFDRSGAQEKKSAAEILGIKRVVVPWETKVEDLVKTEGTLVEVPLAPLEARLERLAKSQSAPKQTPRLVSAVYRAELAGNQLVGGAGQWVVDNPAGGPSIFPIGSLNLALQKPRLDGHDALLGDFAGAGLGLWIEKHGTQTLVFDWSLRGTPSVQGVAFDLRLPPGPLVSIELKLPVDQTLAMAKTPGLLTGPHETQNPVFKIWRVQVAGRSQVELTVRRGNEAGRSPRVFVASETRVQLSPEQTLYETELSQIEVLHAPISELVFEVDPSLQAIDVSSRQTPIQGWVVEPAGKGKNRPLLKVQLREPLLGVLNGLRLRFHGPRWTDREAVVPHIEMRDAISRSESLKLHLHPDQHLERWDAGSFRLLNSATEADGSQALTLADTQPDGKGQRPRFLVRAGGVDFTANQDTRWRLDARGMTLISEIQYDLARGQLFALELRLPKNAAWRIAKVDLQPPDALQKWGVAGDILHVDLQRGITPRSDCKLTVQLDAERDKAPTQSKLVAFPDLEPLGANRRQGTLALLADAHQYVSLVECNVPTSRPDAALAKDPRLQHFFVYRQTPVQGTVKVAPQPAVVHARMQQQVTMTPDLARVKASVTVEPIVGQPAYIDLYFSGSGRQPWKIEAKGAEIARKERLPFGEVARLGLTLAAANPPSRAVATLVSPRGQVWRVHFREPLDRTVELVAQQEFAAPGGNPFAGVPAPVLALDHGIGLAASMLLTRVEREWRIPIVVPLNAERVEGEVSLQPLSTTLTGVQSRGLEAATVASAPSKAARLFRFKEAGLMNAPTLRVKASRRVSDDSAQAILDVAELTTSIDPAGNVVHHLRASVWNWRARDFRVLLPAQTAVVAARLNQIDLDRVPRAERDEGLEVLIPMSQTPGPQTVELLYRSEPNSWCGPLGLTAAAPLPKLPLPPLVMQRRLRLAPDWLPLRQEEFFSLDRRAPAQDAVRRAWRTGESLVEEILPTSPPEWLERQRLSLLGAESSLRGGPREITLGEALSRLLDDSPKDRPRVVLDRVALRTIGLTPKSVAAFALDNKAPFWEHFGLAYVPTPDAALLTSKERAALWTRTLREANQTEPMLYAAVAEAFDFGQDSSGQFCSADGWLRTESEPERSVASAWMSAASDGSSAWLPILGSANDNAIVVVRRSQIRGAAILLGFVAAGIGFAARHLFSARACFRIVWLALTGCVLGVVAAPLSVRELALGPLVAVGLLLAMSYRRLLQPGPQGPPAPRPSRSTQNATKAALAGSLLAAFSFLGLCGAQEAESKSFYIVGADASPNARAFARPELLRWLDEQEKPAEPAAPEAVFLAARYRGSWGPDAVALQAEFDVCTFRDQAALLVPLTGVDLLDGSALDEAPAFPVVAAAGKSGYQIVVPKKGKHRLTLPFIARHIAPGELKFTGPAAPCSSLHLTAPVKLGTPRLVRGWGAESLRQGADKDVHVFEAELGYEPTIHVRGLSAAPAKSKGALRVSELYHWDMRSSFRSAQALFAYRAAGEVGRVEVQIPGGLEVRSVEMIESSPGRAAAIKSWRLLPRDDGRLLQIEFLQPLTGSFQVLVGMAPRWPKSEAKLDLRLPFPLGADIDNGMMGLRLDERDAAEKGQLVGLAAHSPEGFVKEWLLLSQRDVALPLHAFSFARAIKNSAAAAIEVAPMIQAPRVQSEVAWTALPQTIDLIAILNVSSTDDLFFVPVNLSDRIVLRDVQGADVHHWSRQGSTLHVWLVGPRKKTTVTLAGWVPHAYPQAKVINLPAPVVASGAVDTAWLTLASRTRLTLEPKDATGLDEEPGEPGQRRFRGRTGRFPSEFQLRPQAAPAEYQLLTTAEMHGAACSLAAHLHGRIDYGEFPTLQVRLSNWPASPPRLHAAAGADVKYKADGRDHVWIINAPSGAPQQMSFSIKGQWPLEREQTFDLPDVRIERGGVLADRFVALAGTQFAGAALPRTSAVRAATKELYPWPLEHARLRAAGARYVKSPPGGLPPLQPRESILVPPVQILSAHHRVVAGLSGKWLHRMNWALWASEGHDLEIALPRGAVFAAALLDDQPVTPLQTSPATLSLPIAPSQKPREVVIFWRYSTALEPFAHPRLGPARLLGLEGVAVLGELHMPPGWNAADKSWATSKVDVLVHEVQTEAHAFQILGGDLGSAGKAAQAPLVQSLQTFAALVDQAQYRIAAANDPKIRDVLAPQLKLLVDEEQKRAKDFGLDPSRIAAEKSPWLAPPRPPFPGDDNGIPLAWVLAADAEGPRVVLRETAEAPPRRSLLPLAIVVFVLSFWPRGLSVWVRFWPEQLAFLVALGFLLGGFSLIGAGVLLVAILGRGLTFVRGARRLLMARRA